jgi:hypothetical protein
VSWEGLADEAQRYTVIDHAIVQRGAEYLDVEDRTERVLNPRNWIGSSWANGRKKKPPT